MTEQSIELELDKQNFDACLQQLKKALGTASEDILCKVRELLLGTPDLFEKMFRLETNQGATSANKVLVSLNPADSFWVFLLAVGTGDFDILIVES